MRIGASSGLPAGVLPFGTCGATGAVVSGFFSSTTFAGVGLGVGFAVDVSSPGIKI